LPENPFTLPDDDGRIAPPPVPHSLKNLGTAMYRLLVLAIVALLVSQPSPLLAQTTMVPGTAPPPAAENSMLPYVVALGAVAGVLAFNVLALGVEALPGGMAYAGAAVVPAEMSVAMSRVYAATSAVIGGLIADYVYRSK
jgi:hypothetical protein